MILGIGWVGVRTERFVEMMDFYRNVMGLAPTLEIPGQFAMVDRPDGIGSSCSERAGRSIGTSPRRPWRSFSSKTWRRRGC